MGIFDAETSDLFVTYRARLTFRDRVVGGTPSNPKLIEGWLRSKMGVSQDSEVRELTIRTLIELGVDPEVFETDRVDEISFATLQ